MATKTTDSEHTASTGKDTLPPQIEQRIDRIRKQWAILRENWDPANVIEIHSALNQLAELSANEGLSSLADAAFSAEVYLSSFVGTQIPMTPSQRESIDSLLAQLGADHELPSDTDNDVFTPAKRDEIYVIGPLQGSLQTVTTQLQDQGIQLRHLAEISEAHAAIQRELPALIITDARLISDIEPLLEQLADIHKQYGHHVPLVYVSDTDDLETRIRTVRAGGKAFFSPPFNAERINQKLKELKRQNTTREQRILIVEDDISQAEFFASILNKAGFATTVVSRPMETLERLRAFVPDLIIMDIYMPEVDGIELTSVIREYHEFASIPIIFLSGEQDTDRQVDALSVGGDDFITKPIRPKHLIAIVKNRLRRSSQLKREQAATPGINLLTKKQFMERLTTLLTTDPMRVQSTGVLVLSPDHSGQLEQQLGEDGFRQLMIGLAQLLEEQLEDRDSIGQLDERTLGIVSRRRVDREIEDLATRLHKSVGAHNFHIKKTHHSITTGIGLCLADRQEDDANNLLNHARLALQHALNGPQGNTVIYDESFEKLLDASPQTRPQEDSLIEDIRHCLDKDGFVVLFQPLLDLQVRNSRNYEVMLRLPTPKGDLLPPDFFQKPAAQANLTTDIDQWLLSRVLQTLQEHRSANHPTRLFVRQSGSSILDPRYLEWLTEQLRQRKMVGTGLVLDFPLSNLSRDLKAAQKHIGILHDMDIAVCLSQFPEKPAAFKLLRYVQGNYIRVARRLLKTDRDTIVSIVNQAHQAKAKVVISHIDDPRSIDLHWSSGADLLQGDFIQPPMDNLDYDFSQVVI